MSCAYHLHNRTGPKLQVHLNYIWARQSSNCWSHRYKGLIVWRFDSIDASAIHCRQHTRTCHAPIVEIIFRREWKVWIALVTSKTAVSRRGDSYKIVGLKLSDLWRHPHQYHLNYQLHKIDISVGACLIGSLGYRMDKTIRNAAVGMLHDYGGYIGALLLKTRHSFDWKVLYPVRPYQKHRALLLQTPTRLENFLPGDLLFPVWLIEGWHSK